MQSTLLPYICAVRLIRWGEGTKKAREIAVLRFLLLLMGYPAGAPSAEKALRTLQIDEIR